MNEKIRAIFEASDKLTIATSGVKYASIHRCNYVRKSNKLYIAHVENSKTVQQISYFPHVEIVIEGVETYLKIEGRAKIVKGTKEGKTKILSDLKKKDIKELKDIGLFSVVLIEIIPVRLRLYLPKEEIVEIDKENTLSYIKEALLSLQSSLKLFLKSIGLPFLSASGLAVIVGASTAYYETGVFNWYLFILTLLGILLIHSGVDSTNDVYDHVSGTDDINKQVTPFSAGTQVIQGGLYTKSRMLIQGIVLFFLGAIIGLIINFSIPGNVVLFLGIGGIFLGFFYVAFPIKYAYRSVGEIGLFLSFGPLTVYGAYYVQNHVWSLRPLLLSVNVGLLIYSILFINEFPDVEADLYAKKHTWVVKLGKNKSKIIYSIGIGVVYVLHSIFIILNFLPLLAVICYLSLPIALKAVIITLKHSDNFKIMLRAQALTILTMIVYTSLLSLILILSRFFA